jgi:hypothetical protein
MAMRHWLIGLAVAAATLVTAANADDLKLAPKAGIGAPSKSAEIKANGGRANGASEPIAGSYQFLLEVAGVMPAEHSPHTAVSPLRRDSRPDGDASNSTD